MVLSESAVKAEAPDRILDPAGAWGITRRLVAGSGVASGVTSALVILREKGAPVEGGDGVVSVLEENDQQLLELIWGLSARIEELAAELDALRGERSSGPTEQTA